MQPLIAKSIMFTHARTRPSIWRNETLWAVDQTGRRNRLGSWPGLRWRSFQYVKVFLAVLLVPFMLGFTANGDLGQLVEHGRRSMTDVQKRIRVPFTLSHCKGTYVVNRCWWPVNDFENEPKHMAPGNLSSDVHAIAGYRERLDERHFDPGAGDMRLFVYTVLLYYSILSSLLSSCGIPRRSRSIERWNVRYLVMVEGPTRDA